MTLVRVSTTRARSMPHGSMKLRPGLASSLRARPSRKIMARSYSCSCRTPVRTEIPTNTAAAPNDEFDHGG